MTRADVVARETMLGAEPIVPSADDDVVDSNESDEVQLDKSRGSGVGLAGCFLRDDFDNTLGRGESESA